MHVSIVSFSQELAQQLYSSSERFPVNFDDAWQWLEYSRKDSAKRTFLGIGFVEGVDYLLFHNDVECADGKGFSRRQDILLTCECLKQWGMMAGTEKGRQIRLYFLECERVANKFATRPQTTAEMLLMYAQQMVDMERRHFEMQQAITQQQNELSIMQSDVAEIKQRAEDAERSLKALPPADKVVPSRTTRNNLNTLIRSYCHANGVKHNGVWKDLYREFRDRYHVSLTIRASNGKCAPLDMAESLDVIDDLYALACELFQPSLD